MSNEELFNLAIKARENSYAPLSNYHVGASLLADSDKVYSGCNIEDPSGIGVTNICAERTAIIKALSDGVKNFTKIAIVGNENTTEITPCGVCRQYLLSFSPNIKIVCMYEGKLREFTLDELLPYSFNEKFDH